MKSELWILLQIWLLIGAVSGSKLLKVPRIYNALISSDEELLPSQAYPAVAPVLRPSPPIYLTPEFHLEKAEAVSPIPIPSIPEETEVISWDKFKNNKPANPDIPDVPPPPLPVTIRQGNLYNMTLMLNVTTDKLAKQGAETIPLSPEPQCGISPAIPRNALKKLRLTTDGPVPRQ